MNIKEASPFIKILALLLIIVGTFAFTVLVGLISATFIFDLSFSDLEYLGSNLSSNKSVAVLKYLQAIQTIGLFILPAFIFAKMINKGSSCYLKLDVLPEVKAIGLTIIIAFFVLPLINVLGAWNLKMDLPTFLDPIERWMISKEEGASELTKAFLKMNTPGDYWINIFVIALLPALGEELLFRGALQRLLFDWTKNMHVSILFAALLFSALHLQFFGFLPRLALGLLFGYLLYWSDNIWYSVIAHFFNNAIAVTAYYFFGGSKVEENFDTFGTESSDFYIPLIACLVLFFVLKIFYKIKANPNQ